jgi:hypothetical protein
VKYLACVLVACLAWIGGTASAAPTGWTKLLERTGNGVHRFTDSGPDLTVNCYVARDYYVDGLAISCVRVK